MQSTQSTCHSAPGSACRPPAVATGFAVALLAGLHCWGAARAADAPQVGATQEAAAAATTPQPLPRRSAAGNRLEQRVAYLTLQLQLSPAQQDQLRRLLLRQAEAVRRIWTDRTLTDGERGPITSAVMERTADDIRALLSEEQRKRYNPPRPPEATPSGADLGRWLDALRPK